jgi:hypothetical protein
MGVTAEFTGGCTDVLTAAPITTALPRTTTALALMLPRTTTAATMGGGSGIEVAILALAALRECRSRRASARL